MFNLEIRQAIQGNRLRHYEVAQAVGVSEYTFSVWLRKELSAEKAARIKSAIERLSAKVKGGGAE